MRAHRLIILVLFTLVKSGFPIGAEFHLGGISSLVTSHAGQKNADFGFPIMAYADGGIRFPIPRWYLEEVGIACALKHGALKNRLDEAEDWRDTRIDVGIRLRNRLASDRIFVKYGLGLGYNFATIDYTSDDLDSSSGKIISRKKGDRIESAFYQYGTGKLGLEYVVLPGRFPVTLDTDLNLNLRLSWPSSLFFAPPDKFVEIAIGLGFYF